MNEADNAKAMRVIEAVSPRAARIGVTTWAALGAIGLTAVFAYLFSATASISVPVLIALVLGFLFAPAVVAMEKRHVPRSLGAALVLLALVLVFIALFVMVAWGIADTLSGLGDDVQEGIVAVEAWAVELDIPEETATSVSASVQEAVPSLGVGLVGTVTTGLSNTIGSLVMSILALYICYLMLVSGNDITDWIGGHLGVPHDVGDEIVQDAAAAIRGYFKGATLLGIVTGAATAIGLWLVGAPLPLVVGVLTLVLSYIPYIGAFVAGAFAVVLAFGAGGWELALYALLVVLFVQMILQSVVQAPLMGSALQLNAVVVFVLTMLGGVVAGALGAMLAAPALSAILEINRTLAKWHERRDGGGVVASPQET
jgi:predicted PurR-regulated permease PerM